MSNKRVAVYMRNPQSTKEMLDEAHAYCVGKQMEIVGTYTDVGISGETLLAERPTGKLLMQDAEAGKFDVVLVHSVDRIGRHADAVLRTITGLRQWDVEIRLVDGDVEINEATISLAKIGQEIMDELEAICPDEGDEDESN